MVDGANHRGGYFCFQFDLLRFLIIILSYNRNIKTKFEWGPIAIALTEGCENCELALEFAVILTGAEASDLRYSKSTFRSNM